MNNKEKRPKVLFFDINETLLDLSVMKRSISNALLGREDLLSLWFNSLLHYSLVSTVAEHYNNFDEIGAATLRMIAANNGIDLSENEAREAVSVPMSIMPPHPEVKDGLRLLKENGYTLVSLTNSSLRISELQFEHAGITDVFDQRLSVEEVGKFKPHTSVYNWAAKRMNAQPNECMLIAAHGWDIAGALWAGWRAAFVSRKGQQLYPLAPLPEIIEPDLIGVSRKLIELDK